MSIRRVAETADVTQKSQVGNDSIVGEYTKIAEKSSVKRSIIGAHCIIGKNVKIANSIIMDHVVLEDSYVLYYTPCFYTLMVVNWSCYLAVSSWTVVLYVAMPRFLKGLLWPSVKSQEAILLRKRVSVCYIDDRRQWCFN